MARLESIKIGGYYPAPADLLSSFASTSRWPSAEEIDGPCPSLVLVDPCAGEGEAIAGLRDAWALAHPHLKFRIVANEMEGGRGRALRKRFVFSGDVTTVDAFCLDWTREADGAALLWANPPYSAERGGGREEHRWLVRFTECLHRGAGHLMFLIPAHALAASAEFLARNYVDIRCWRLPEEHFKAFRQVLLVGRRAAEPLPLNRMAGTIARWAEAPASLPELAPTCADPIRVIVAPEYTLRFTARALDVKGALESFRPWQGTALGLEDDARRLIGTKVRTAMPPRAAHIAMALASGQFNGHELIPNNPDRHPAILAKGVFGRQRLQVSESVDKKGNVTGRVEIEQPKLELSILRLDTYTYEAIVPGTEPTGSDDPAHWNAADVVVGYDRSFAELLKRQFPPIHDPSDPAHQMALPALARDPYEAQREAIQAALKLLALGRNPFIAAEVGVGKSTIALYVAAALMEKHWQRTVDELARLGFRGRLPRVGRVLVVCPPHLLDSWTEQVAAILPEARVQVLAGFADLEKDADIYLLSRETAKLGHAVRGVEGHCPRCGAGLPRDAATNASRRLACGSIGRRARNDLAQLAQKLACAIAGIRPAALDDEEEEDSRVDVLLPRTLRRLEPKLGRVIRRRVAAEVHEALVLRACTTRENRPWQLMEAVKGLARALSVEMETADCLAGAAGPVGGEHHDRGLWYASEELRAPKEADAADEVVRAIERLTELGRWDESGPCGERLYQAVPEPRRFPLARYILRRHRRRMSMVILDESHEANNQGSAQSKAMHRLTGLPGVPTLALTGSLTGGYASSLFANWWVLSRDFRAEFGRGDKGRFVATFGFRKIQVGSARKHERKYGTSSDRELQRDEAVIGEAPGIAPAFVMRHLLPSAVIVHKSDLDQELPPMTETPVAVDISTAQDGELLAEYRRLEDILLDRIRAERFDPELSGRLLGALLELPSYLERCAEECGPFRIRYPESCGGQVLAEAKLFPSSWRSPKERFLLAELKARLAAGEKVLLFARHTGTAPFVSRLLRLVRSEVTPRAVFLDASKVTTGKREAWIRQEVIRKDIPVVVVSPRAVMTGLNVLVAFSTAIWYELDWSTYCYRQANGRLHRIGQNRPVSIVLPYHAETAQEVALDLIARKVTASLQLDGLSIQGALEAAGASEEASSAMAVAMSIGETVFRELVRRRT
ncbi:MAG: DUF6094 domain-containing protein [Acidobacteriota bacterium]